MDQLLIRGLSNLSKINLIATIKTTYILFDHSEITISISLHRFTKTRTVKKALIDKRDKPTIHQQKRRQYET